MPNSKPVLAFLLMLGGVSLAGAQQPLRLRETIQPGQFFQVHMRVDLGGSLDLPLENGENRPRQLTIKGQSTVNYAERILALNRASQVERTIRLYQKMEFERKVGDQLQQTHLRPQVRRLVLLRHQQMEVPFSPDGPLTWGEIDLVRTDVFTPALLGLLPEVPVRPGDSWNASTAAVQELTDFERIERGSLVCRFEEITALAGRRQARMSFRGTIQGIGEDGPSRHDLNGTFYFDLESNHLGSLSMQGTHHLLDKDGKSAGKIEGSFILSRQPVPRCPELADEELRRISTEPNEENTQLLYENPDLGLRFLYPRHWRVAGERGRQLGVDEKRGNGLLLTVEPAGKVPTGQQFLQESRTYLQQQKATILRTAPVVVWLRTPRLIESFSIDIEVNKQRARMLYVVVRHNDGSGVLLAARLLMDANLTTVQREVQGIAMSIQQAR